jgi:hypothetical protein
MSTQYFNQARRQSKFVTHLHGQACLVPGMGSVKINQATVVAGSAIPSSTTGPTEGRNGKLHQKVSLTHIRRLMRATDCKDALTFSIPELDLKLLEAKKKHKDTTYNSAQLGCVHVDKLDEARANHNQTLVAAKRAQRKQTQRQREQGRVLARLKKKTRQPVTMVTAKINGIPTPQTTKEDIAQACIAENDS